MTKKRMFTYVGIGLVLVYVLGLVICFTGASVAESERFSSAVRQLPFGFGGNIYYRNSDDNIDEKIQYSQSVMQQFPYVAVAYDKAGNIVAQTGNYLSINTPDGSIYCYLDKYLDEDMRVAIAELIDGNNFIQVTKFKYYIHEDIVIPIYIEFKGNQQGELYYEFSGDREGVVVDFSKTVSVYLHEYDLCTSFYDKKIYEELKEQITSYQFKQEALERIGGGGGYTSADEINYINSIQIDGEDYVVCQLAKKHSFFQPLFSAYFQGFVLEFTFGFVILSIVLLIFANKLYNKNKQLEDARIAFTSAAAHELKTPLAVISNQCECIIENVAPEKNTEYINSIYAETVRMNKLVKTLLEYNRITTAEKIEKEPCNLSSVAKKELEKYRPMFEEKGISVGEELDSANIECNIGLISLVVDNYLSNALKNTPENGEIKLSVKNESGKIKLTLFNSGSHISHDHGKHIWEEFYRIDSVRNSAKNSSGMGLAICRKILELHGFKYGYASTDEGVEFYFLTT